MALVKQSFDVKINIIRPYITKNLSADDITRISETTNLKYESLKTITPQAFFDEDAGLSDTEVISEIDKRVKELNELIQEFDDLEEKATRAMNKIVFTYDVSDPANEFIANAERAIFGSASGVITFSKYKKLMEFEEIINRELQERMVNNNGVLDGVA